MSVEAKRKFKYVSASVLSFPLFQTFFLFYQDLPYREIQPNNIICAISCSNFLSSKMLHLFYFGYRAFWQNLNFGIVFLTFDLAVQRKMKKDKGELFISESFNLEILCILMQSEAIQNFLQIQAVNSVCLLIHILFLYCFILFYLLQRKWFAFM